jgi:hypothetical protein
MAGISKTKYTSQYIDNMGFDDELKVPMVEIINSDGTLQSTYNYIKSEETTTYKYYGFANLTSWRIKRKTLATGVWEIAYGDFTGTYANFDDAWTAKAGLSYSYA